MEQPSVYVVVYGEKQSDFLMFGSYTLAMRQLRIRALNNPRFTSRIEIYRRDDEGSYHKDTSNDSDDEW